MKNSRVNIAKAPGIAIVTFFIKFYQAIAFQDNEHLTFSSLAKEK